MAEVVSPLEVEARIITKEGASGVVYKSFFSHDNGKALSCSVVTIQPGGNTVIHSHKPEHIHYILSGTGILVYGNYKELHVEAGMATYIPGNERHFFRNTGSEPLQMIAFRGSMEHEDK